MNRPPEHQQVFICAGETSGDHHGSGLISAMRKSKPDLHFLGIGGDKMVKAGMEPLLHIRDMSIIGFTEVVKQFPKILRIFRNMVAVLRERRPDYVILIDYPGFNLKLAKEARKLSIPVIYYISPQVWAWGRKRLSRIAATVDLMLVIFPFEEAIFREAGVEAQFVGHPLKDSVKAEMTKTDFFQAAGLNPDQPVIGLLPGSRHQEITRLLPEMRNAVKLLKQTRPGLQVVLGKAPGIEDGLYDEFLSESPEIITVRDQTWDVMAHSDLLIAASGTATLEAALLNTPMVIVYRMSGISYLIAKRIVRIDDVGLVNIVAGKRLVPELIQSEANAQRIAEEARRFLENRDYLKSVKEGLIGVADRLGSPGATPRAAEAILQYMERRS